ncbi:hypothetical protein GCM10009738_52660 [Kitasatospora viridis]
MQQNGNRGDEGDGDGSNCHLKIVKKADRDFYLPGQKVTYTITLTNDGDQRITGAVVTDDLSGDLQDGVYDNDAHVGRGSLSYNAPILTWVGDLRPGQSTEIVYSVTADNPDNGPKHLIDAVTGPSFSNCPTGTEDGCHLNLGSPHWVVSKREDRSDVEPADTIRYTITATNDGTVDFTGARQAGLEDDMSQIVGESAYDYDATADFGTVSFRAPAFVVWRGDLPAGATINIHLSIKAEGLKPGSTELVNIVRALYPHHGGTDLSNPLPPQGPREEQYLAQANSRPVNGPAHRTAQKRDTVGANGQITACNVDPATDACYVDADEPNFVVSKQVDHDHAMPGDVLTYTVQYANTGNDQFPTGELPVLTDDLSQVLQHSTFVAGSLSSTVPTATFDPSAKAITWTGQLTSGQHGQFTYQVKVNDPYYGDKFLDNTITSAKSTDCQQGSTDARCKAHVVVQLPTPTPTPTPTPSKMPPPHHEHHEHPHHPGQLAHTGADGTMVLAGSAAALVLGGGTLLLLNRRRTRRH